MQYVKFEYDTKYFGGNYSGTGAIAFVPKDLVDKVGYEEAFETETELEKCHIIHYDADSVYNENHELIEEPESNGRVDTVNVVEIFDGNVHIHSFYDNEEGNKSAKALFTHLVKDNMPHVTTEELDYFLNTGWDDNNEYSIQIVKNNKTL